MSWLAHGREALDVLHLPRDHSTRERDVAVERFLFALQPIPAPLYVTTAHAEATPAVRAALGNCGGVYSGLNDVTARTELGGRWRGRGRCLIVQDFEAAFLFKREWLDAPAFSNAVALATIGMALHEFAHCLDFDGATLPDEPPDVERHVAAWSTLADADPPRVYEPPAVPWHRHGLRFHRALLHLLARLQEQHGDFRWLAQEHVGAGDVYALPPLQEMREALGDEPQRAMEVAIWKTLNEPAPAAFEGLFPQGAEN